MLKKAMLILALANTQLLVGTTIAQEVAGCGVLQNAFGPFDYRDSANRDQLKVVETYHFTASVESLAAGSTGAVVQDLDYTLRAFPNHYRALNAIGNFGLHGGKFQSATISSAECYFARAVAFRPDDAVVRVLFGNYLYKSGQRDRAKEEYERALALAPDSQEISYNSGLFFLAIGDLTRARELAQITYRDGYPLQGLKRKLEEAEVARKSK